MTASPVCASRLPVGSSASRIGGRATKARQSDTLLLAAGQVFRVVREPLSESNALEHARCRLQRGFAAAAAGMARQFERQQHVLERVQVRQQLERLEYETNLLRPHARAAVFIERKQVVAEEVDRAPRRNVEAGQQSKQRRFARTGAAGDCYRLAGRDSEVDIIENRQGARGVLHDFCESLRLKCVDRHRRSAIFPR
jgi:hypothetical protein